ncbi:hypothetical protein [Solidesulfovibrio carbinolicus]|uniref:Uncharacterized protein n=1 Tax=Solidesulfovibrio carbinolicus TaxID=296842 RepID=A0A4P6HJI4_9BACT|nr:hypothetical protein [Solidesulfovibrio carbinolicus]QAZ66624.1 hypothetical protein C3Y92_04955 [Solidesulfovibrio carbinolicus]
MVWKKIPPEADYFHCEPGTDYFICEEGFVVEGRFLQDGQANLDKAIWPTVQGNRAYIRVRRKGVDKKFQLVRIFAELFPELLAVELTLRTRKGPYNLRIEADAGDEPAAERPAAAKARKEKPVRKERERERERERELPEEADEEIVEAPEEAFAEDEDEDEPAVAVADHRLCRVCNLRKRSSEFSPREDMCLDCYMGRDELLKEIIARRRRKSKPAAPRVTEENVERGGMEDNLDSFGSMDFGISLPE